MTDNNNNSITTDFGNLSISDETPLRRRYRKEINKQRKLIKNEYKKDFVPPIVSEDKEANKAIFVEMHNGSKERKFSYFKEDLKCSVCWLLLCNCMCNLIEKVKLKHEYLFLFHPSEWCRASNTGKVLLLSDKSNEINVTNDSNKTDDENILNSPTRHYNYSIYNNLFNQNSNSKIYTMGEKIDEDLFFKKLETCSRDSTFVLFPSQDSINIKDVLKSKSIILNNDQLFKSKDQDTAAATATAEDDDITTITDSIKKINFKNIEDVQKLEKLTIIIADGTWTNAKSINKRIPKDIKRIHLEFGDLRFKSLFNAIRSQPQVDRISTMEATILSMKSLGESDEVCQKLINALQLLIATVIKQNNKQPIIHDKKWVGDMKHLNRNKYHNNNNTTTTTTTETTETTTNNEISDDKDNKL